MRVSRSCLNQITFTFLTIALVQVYPNKDLTKESWYDNYRNYNKIFRGSEFFEFV
ncbi:hypothetical protein GLOIN_2v1583975 [Rhizophagus irregularis DAOM 181602=DAOM 197198]|uniref:Uncharacterized protein n=1 Tax=Rhizophagus irregularis (strain DAOM 181602 / DAOM 197198 / MUCL 43194) TaxID=747089 RepID=A0A2P4Q7N0_RHIID|nr:hypothetical protein GLOIN_2v1583975 [Rhizophagus irregularis DAOM 181602=DAOM 197198]POG73637.1 hypothetical protein GLOIN_2v1583975 [Rhizophagus irregularis DAOM 181602=DAOM 197198]|eukprot:XP_025180503.1 hypothetical protein GLOIN_2v1583975 [Rhizophagus irregularis DAOM 181602=DAOM 197198]